MLNPKKWKLEKLVFHTKRCLLNASVMDHSKSIKLTILKHPPPRTFKEKVNMYFQQKMKYEWPKNTKKALSEIYNFINSFENNRDLVNEINVIDTLCCNAMKIMSIQDMLQTLCIMSTIYPHQVVNTDFYTRAIKALKENMYNNKLNTSEIIEFLYLVALKKKKMAYNISTLLCYIPDIKGLDIIEQCLIADSAFKSAVKLKEDQIRQIEEVLEEKAEFLVENEIYIVPLCKIIRLTGCTKQFDLSKLSECLINKSRTYNIMSATHVLQLYAELHIANEKVINHLTKDIMMHIMKRNHKCDRRNTQLQDKYMNTPKYLESFLSAIAKCAYELDNEMSKQIIICVNNTFSSLIAQPERLAKILLSLWMLNIKMEEIIKKSLNLGIFKEINDGNLWKTKAKLNLLLYCIKIESPDIVIPQELMVQNAVGYTIPETVKIVYAALLNLADHLQLRNIKINCAVPAIYIPGVSCAHTSIGLIHIDMLDTSTCLKSAKLIPHGWMKLKLRLLKQMGYQSILVMGESITNAEDVNGYITDCVNKKFKETL